MAKVNRGPENDFKELESVILGAEIDVAEKEGCMHWRKWWLTKVNTLRSEGAVLMLSASRSEDAAKMAVWIMRSLTSMAIKR